MIHNNYINNYSAVENEHYSVFNYYKFDFEHSGVSVCLL